MFGSVSPVYTRNVDESNQQLDDWARILLSLASQWITTQSFLYNNKIAVELKTGLKYLDIIIYLSLSSSSSFFKQVRSTGGQKFLQWASWWSMLDFPYSIDVVLFDGSDGRCSSKQMYRKQLMWAQRRDALWVASAYNIVSPSGVGISSSNSDRYAGCEVEIHIRHQIIFAEGGQVLLDILVKVYCKLRACGAWWHVSKIRKSIEKTAWNNKRDGLNPTSCAKISFSLRMSRNTVSFSHYFDALQAKSPQFSNIFEEDFFSTQTFLCQF